MDKITIQSLSLKVKVYPDACISQACREAVALANHLGSYIGRSLG